MVYTPPLYSDHIGVALRLDGLARGPALRLASNPETRKAQPHTKQQRIGAMFAAAGRPKEPVEPTVAARPAAAAGGISGFAALDRRSAAAASQSFGSAAAGCVVAGSGARAGSDGRAAPANPIVSAFSKAGTGKVHRANTPSLDPPRVFRADQVRVCRAQRRARRRSRPGRR